MFKPIDYIWHEQAAILQPFSGGSIIKPAVVVKDKDLLINVALMIIKNVHTDEQTFKTLILDWLNQSVRYESLADDSEKLSQVKQKIDKYEA